MKRKRRVFAVMIMMCMMTTFSVTVFAGNIASATIKPAGEFYMYGSADIDSGGLFGNPYTYMAIIYGNLAETQTESTSKCYYSVGQGTSYTNIASDKNVWYGNPVSVTKGMGTHYSRINMRIWYGSSYDAASEKASFSAYK